MRKFQFSNDNCYHIYNRGVEKRPIFHDLQDFQRLYESLYLFNDSKYQNSGTPFLNEALLAGHESNDRDLLVKIISFCLLPNHFHLMLQQVKDGGISSFMHRLGMGYAHYFNIKYGRSGRLFESTFQAVQIQKDSQFDHLPRYIHLNVLDLTDSEWRNCQATNWDLALKSLNNYKWSSHHIYAGRAQPLPVVDEDSVRAMHPNVEEYLLYLKNYACSDTVAT